LVAATVACEGGRAVKVTLDMPPAFVARRDALIDTPQWGPVRYDLCFGGVFYALVDAAQTGLAITPANARALAIAGVDLRNRIAAVEPALHPVAPALNGLAYVMFRAEEPDGAVRTCTTLRPGRADRSPCGTGSNANMAVRFAQGRVKLGDEVVSRSIIGGEFTTQFVARTAVGPFAATRNRVSGRCWIYGISQIGLDPTDPFPEGFTLSDTWGG
jgi:proline racemase